MSESDSVIEVWCKGEQWCPITVTATLIGKKWHPVILHRPLVTGLCGFSELQERIEGIWSKVLSEALEDLGKKKLVNREVVNDRPFRVHYSLAKSGKALSPVLKEMYQWGQEYVAPPAEQREVDVMPWDPTSE